jgi:hypothetical protein
MNMSIRRSISSLGCAILLAGLSATPVAAREYIPDASWYQHAIPVADSTAILAMAADRALNTIALLYADTDKNGDQQLWLLAFDKARNKIYAPDPRLPLSIENPPMLLARGGLAVDESGTAYLATAGNAGSVRLVRIDLKVSSAPLQKVLPVGANSVAVSTLRLSHQGMLMLVGAADGMGFVASISPSGKVNWIGLYDNVAVMMDLIESGDGFVLTGGTAGKIFPQDVWLARISSAGEVLQSQLRQRPTAYAYLASDGRRIGLSYEKLNADLESGTALLEILSNSPTLRRGVGQTIFEGRLDAPFALSGDSGGFTAAGIATEDRLQIVQLKADGRRLPLYKGQLKAPDYVRFHSVEIIRGADANYLGALRSHAVGRRQQMELVFARIPSM